MGQYSTNPVVRKKQIRIALHQARQKAGLDHRQAAQLLGWTYSKVIQIETGLLYPSSADLASMALCYGLPKRENIREDVIQQEIWYSEYQPLSQEFLTLLEWESSAVAIRAVNTGLIPGLLQTRTYAESVIKWYDQAVGVPEDTISQSINIRMMRQKILERDNPPQVHFLLDESVIRRTLTHREAMREQLAKLKDIYRLPNVTLQIIPFSTNPIEMTLPGFVVYEFPQEQADFALYRENFFTKIYTSFGDSAENALYLERFYKLADQALSLNESEEFIGEVLAEYD